MFLESERGTPQFRVFLKAPQQIGPARRDTVKQATPNRADTIDASRVELRLLLDSHYSLLAARKTSRCLEVALLQPLLRQRLTAAKQVQAAGESSFFAHVTSHLMSNPEALFWLPCRPGRL